VLIDPDPSASFYHPPGNNINEEISKPPFEGWSNSRAFLEGPEPSQPENILFLIRRPFDEDSESGYYEG
jgi:hypothetical protein